MVAPCDGVAEGDGLASESFPCGHGDGDGLGSTPVCWCKGEEGGIDVDNGFTIHPAGDVTWAPRRTGGSGSEDSAVFSPDGDAHGHIINRLCIQGDGVGGVVPFRHCQPLRRGGHRGESIKIIGDSDGCGGIAAVGSIAPSGFHRCGDPPIPFGMHVVFGGDGEAEGTGRGDGEHPAANLASDGKLAAVGDPHIDIDGLLCGRGGCSGQGEAGRLPLGDGSIMVISGDAHLHVVIHHRGQHMGNGKASVLPIVRGGSVGDGDDAITALVHPVVHPGDGHRLGGVPVGGGEGEGGRGDRRCCRIAGCHRNGQVTTCGLGSHHQGVGLAMVRTGRLRHGDGVGGGTVEGDSCAVVIHHNSGDPGGGDGGVSRVA